ncbi:MAG: ABC transporter ATP-binding protein/permease, partial [Gammaproteobacteria bacterium]|nr:ABC transporter ATP-binding protein/permease [Gammaproteobacteria bacterium]
GEVCDGLSFTNLTLYSPNSNRVLVRDLTLDIPKGSHVLIHVTSQSARQALIRATAGIWMCGEGLISRPAPDTILFLPQRPYLPPGTLRELLLRTNDAGANNTEMLVELLESLGIGNVIKRAEGLDNEIRWNDTLSLGEQQMITVARLLLAKPDYVFLDRPGSALGEEGLRRVLNIFTERGISYLTIGARNDPEESYNLFIDIAYDGSWLCYDEKPGHWSNPPSENDN